MTAAVVGSQKTHVRASAVFPDDLARRRTSLAAEPHRVIGFDSPDLADVWSVGRFIQRDPVLANWSRDPYAYAQDVPTQFRDPAGEDAKTIEFDPKEMPQYAGKPAFKSLSVTFDTQISGCLKRGNMQYGAEITIKFTLSDDLQELAKDVTTYQTKKGTFMSNGKDVPLNPNNPPEDPDVWTIDTTKGDDSYTKGSSRGENIHYDRPSVWSEGDNTGGVYERCSVNHETDYRTYITAVILNRSPLYEVLAVVEWSIRHVKQANTMVCIGKEGILGPGFKGEPLIRKGNADDKKDLEAARERAAQWRKNGK